MPKKVTKYKCPECGKILSTVNGFYGHLRLVHGKDESGNASEYAVEKEIKGEEEKSFGKDLEEEFQENLRFSGLEGGHWGNKRKGISKLFFAGEPSQGRLYWAMNKAGANPLQTNLMLHLWFGDKADYNTAAKEAQELFKKKKEGESELSELFEGEDDMDEEKLVKLIRKIKKEESEDDIWKRVERIYALKALDKALGEKDNKGDNLSSLRQLMELKTLFNDPNVNTKISELEKKIADDREKTILEALIKTMGQSKKPESDGLVKAVLDNLSRNQETIEKLKEKTEEMRYQSMKEYLDRVLSLVAERESWDTELKKTMKEEMTKTLKEKLKAPLGREKSKADMAKEIIEGTIDKIKEPMLRPIGNALAENIRKGGSPPSTPPTPSFKSSDLRQEKQLDLIKNAELERE